MAGEIISGIAIVLVAIIEAIAAMDRKRSKSDRQRSERRAAVRAEESKLAMQMMDANLDLALATATAVEQGKLNGEMKAARDKAREAQENYRMFIRNVAAREVVKI